MIIGQYAHIIDDKGRLTIPAKIREKLTEGAIITKGHDGCLAIYPQDEWQKKQVELKQLSMNHASNRMYLRVLLANACECEFDKQGRVNIPLHLRKEANLEKDCIIVGMMNQVEIWSHEKWNEHIAIGIKKFEENSELI